MSEAPTAALTAPEYAFCPANTNPGETITLDASASTGDPTPDADTGFSWKVTRNGGTPVVLEDTTDTVQYQIPAGTTSLHIEVSVTNGVSPDDTTEADVAIISDPSLTVTVDEEVVSELVAGYTAALTDTTNYHGLTGITRRFRAQKGGGSFQDIPDATTNPSDWTPADADIYYLGVWATHNDVEIFTNVATSITVAARPQVVAAFSLDVPAVIPGGNVAFTDESTGSSSVSYAAGEAADFDFDEGYPITLVGGVFAAPQQPGVGYIKQKAANGLGESDVSAARKLIVCSAVPTPVVTMGPQSLRRQNRTRRGGFRRG